MSLHNAHFSLLRLSLNLCRSIRGPIVHQALIHKGFVQQSLVRRTLHIRTLNIRTLDIRTLDIRTLDKQTLDIPTLDRQTLDSQKHHQTYQRQQSSNFSTSTANMAAGGIATYEEIKELPNKKEVLLIDVREPQELKETGVIPSSINIPLGQVEDVLKNLSEAEFEKKYGRKKPTKSTPVIFSCKAGKRGDMAMQTALKLGYSNVKNYAGAWMEWESRLKK